MWVDEPDSWKWLISAHNWFDWIGTSPLSNQLATIKGNIHAEGPYTLIMWPHMHKTYTNPCSTCMSHDHHMYIT